MSYALETKKRKFDRLLESLSEPLPPPKPAYTSSYLSSLSTATTSRAPLYSRKNPSSTISSLNDSLKRRRITPTSTSSKTGASSTPADPKNVYLPSLRSAFLARLETFRLVTKWHIPSTGAVNAAEWAKRGWCCVDVDTVGCGACGCRVVVDLAVEDNRETEKENLETGAKLEQTEDEERQETREVGDDDDDIQAQIYDALVKRYQETIVTGHAENCLWRRRGCDSSIQRIEGLLNANTAVRTLRTRYEGIKEQIEEVPCVVLSNNDSQENSLSVNDTLLDETDLEFEGEHKLDAMRLAMCGWQRKDTEVVECQHCFRSLGLWLYRGNEPAMENLDAVDSHLEYCPWRSADAQDTEIPVPNTGWVDGKQQKAKYPGWALVYLAVVKHSAKKKGGLNASSLSLSSSVTDGNDPPQDLSPEQREKRMKDLMTRIKEIKKPFNVRALLRRKPNI